MNKKINSYINNIEIEQIGITNDLIDIANMIHIQWQKVELPLLEKDVKIYKSYKTYIKKN